MNHHFYSRAHDYVLYVLRDLDLLFVLSISLTKIYGIRMLMDNFVFAFLDVTLSPFFWFAPIVKN